MPVTAVDESGIPDLKDGELHRKAKEMSAVQDGTNYAFWSDEQRRCYDMWGTKNPPPEEIKYEEPDHDDDGARPDEQSIEDEE